MGAIAELRALDPRARAAVAASVLGWTLDAFDFFLMVFMFDAIAKEFGTDIKAVSVAVMLTLAARPFGALVFGWLADRFGRRPVLMADILLYSVLELASGFAPSLPALLVLRTLFGFAMGGEWGIGASLAMESIPASARGIVSGLLQEGYALGYLLASVVFYLLFDRIGWRGMFMVGVAPALVVALIRTGVHESPAFERTRDRPPANPLRVLAQHWRTTLYVVLLMAAFNFFSHGTQDMYPTFLKVQHGYSTHRTGLITAVMNVGAITGGLLFGAWSERIGRRRAIAVAALLALPVLPLWAFAGTPLLLGAGAFLMQVAVQGAWGIVPAHLNELSPEGVRGLFPGFAYQAGNLLAAVNGPLQARIAEAHGKDYGLAMAIVAGITAVVLASLSLTGPERKGRPLDGSDAIERP